MGFTFYQVPMVEQGPNPICWVASAAMILSWKQQRSVSIGDLIGADPSNSSIGNPATSYAQVRASLQGWGFTVEPQNMSVTSDYLDQRLQAHGPLLFPHLTEGFPYDSRFPPYTCSPLIAPGGHAIVLIGFNSDDNTCAFKNPWGSAGIVDVAVVLDAIATLAEFADTFPGAFAA